MIVRKGLLGLINHRGFSKINLEGELVYDWRGFDPRAFVGIPAATPARTFLSLFAVTRERLFIDMSDKGKTEVYFDGACPLCRREISLYRKLDKEGVVSWVDVANCHPTVSGLTKDELLKRFHIKNKQGVILSGAGLFLIFGRSFPGGSGWVG